ncbi:restriction endonuclease [Streptomyces solincola]|uniref:Restriction endonuclease n=1 Tax=Streptomyces solincola TaxID=2100817 RepID=A0A2S9PVC9_9ACTN|nr:MULTISPECIES: Uma2 family endonuclease [Streptomyces]PRH78365.1 restriction endonuclease [Streptomyces solincola]
MTAVPVGHDPAPEPPQTWAYMLNAWHELDVPEGWRAEIDEGQIVLVPPPHRHHNAIAELVQHRLYRGLPEELGIYQTLGLHIAPLDKLYVPDLVIVPRETVLAGDPDRSEPVDAALAELIVEVTSPHNAADDRTRKYRAYALSLVPLYLLIDRYDRRGPTVTLFSAPQDGVFKHSQPVPFGTPLALPAPFGVTLDTGAFPGAGAR